MGERTALVSGTDTVGELLRNTAPGEERTGVGVGLSATGGVELPRAGGVEPSLVGTGVCVGATHLVQIVEVTECTTVESVKDFSTTTLVPDVTVFVTGQVVTVVYTLGS